MIKIIIIDDHQLFIDGIINSFARDRKISVIGYALDGTSGLEMIQQQKPDIVLLDIDFSKTHENGLDILKAIRRLTHQPQVIVLTGHCDESLINKLFQQGANGFRLKNIGLSELRQTILDVFNGEVVLKFDSQIIATHNEAPFYNFPVLSDRMLEIIKLLAKGYAVKEIAQNLSIAETTVNDHLERARRKLGAKNNVELIFLAGKTRQI